MNLLFEDLIRIESDKFICRIWRGRDDENPGPSNEMLRFFVEGFLTDKRYNITEMVTSIVSMGRVNSVEIVDKSDGSCGVCVHRDWP